MYADTITGSIERAVRETDRRRKLQVAHNKKHGITPTTITREIRDMLPTLNLELKALPKDDKAIKDLTKQKEKEMKEAAKNLDFELAAILRDEIHELESKIKNQSDKSKLQNS